MNSTQNADAVFDIFKLLNKVPRPSWHEEKAADFLCDFAKRLNLTYERDKQNCVIIHKPATPGYENAETIILLNHMDMVCVAEKGKKFDPLNSPIESYIDNGFMKARGTSLGADNGIGLCMALAVLADDTIIHGPLEFIATTNEEDGMTGAANLSTSNLKGRKVINLDSEDYDTITIGSAGADLRFTTLPIHKIDTPQGYSFFNVTIDGGLGGHSGVDINKGRSNAIKLLAKILHTISEKMNLLLASFDGGQANNAIPVHATANIGIKSSLVPAFKTLARTQLLEIMHQFDYVDTDAEVHIDIKKINNPTQIIDKKASDSLLTCLDALPYGAMKMCDDMPDTVETSNNTGKVETHEDSIFISNYSRSFIDNNALKLGNNISSMFDSIGAHTEIIMQAPAWKSEVNTPFKKLTEDIFMEKLGFKPRKVAMHFALEAGYFVEKIKGIEIVSIGPKIIEPHSTSERVDVQTISNIWIVLVELLNRLAKA